MKKLFIPALTLSLLITANPLSVEAQSSGGGMINLPAVIRTTSAARRAANVASTQGVISQGQVLGAFTAADAETQAKIDGIKTQLATLIKALIAALQAQLAAAASTGN